MREIKNMLITILLSVTMTLGGLPLGIFAEGENEEEVTTPIEDSTEETGNTGEEIPSDDGVTQSEPSTPSEPSVPSDSSTPQEQSEDAQEKEPIEETEQAKEYNLTLYYKDKDSNEEIAPSQTLQFKGNDTYSIESYLTVEGYTFKEASDKTEGTMPENDMTITLLYEANKIETYSLTINYYELNKTIPLKEATVIKDLAGDFDYSETIAKHINNTEIEGYVYASCSQDPKGTMNNQDVAINLYYKQKSKIIVTYVDKDANKEIANEMSAYPDNDGNYDVSKYDARKIDGYKYVKTDGMIKGNLPAGSEDLVIKVYYEKIETTHSITINYLDYDTGKILSSPTIVNDIKENQKYDLYSKFKVTNTKLLKDGYILIEPQILRGTMGTEDIVINAYYKVDEEIIYSKVYVNYLELETNKVIHKQFVSTDIQQGDIYNVTKQDAISIAGYRYVKTEGDTCDFMTNHDVTINVYYKKAPNQYRVTINYLNMDGKSIKSSITTNLMDENSTYNVSKYNAVKINGYRYVKTTGDSISGVLTSNKVINVYYEKLSFSESVKTGDYTNIYLWIGVGIVAIIVLVVLIRKYRK